MSLPQDEEATLQYLDWQDLYETEKPYQLFSAISSEDLPNRRTTNLIFKEGDRELIRDVRKTESQFTLDRQGFTFISHRTAIQDFKSSEEIENGYLPEVETLLQREMEGVDQVYFFDWRVCGGFIVNLVEDTNPQVDKEEQRAYRKDGYRRQRQNAVLTSRKACPHWYNIFAIISFSKR